MTKSTRKFVILYQSRDRRLVLHFLPLFENRWMFRFIFMMSKSWPATETAKLHYNTMSLPVRLISVPWGTNKAGKCYRWSFDLVTAAVDRAGLARTKKTLSLLLAIQTSRSVHQRGKQSALNDITLSDIVPLSLKQGIIFTPKIVQLSRNRSGDSMRFTFCFFQHYCPTKRSRSTVYLTHAAYQIIKS